MSRSHDLRDLADRVAAALVETAAPAAVLLAGSVADGGCDEHSDVDLIAYGDLPTEDQLETLRAALDATEPHWAVDARDAGRLVRAFHVDGTECQLAVVTVSEWEADLDRLMAAEDTCYDLQKAVIGLLHGVPLHGAPVIEAWQRQVGDMPPALALRMVTANLDIFPLWRVDDHLAARDAVVFTQQMLVDGALRLLGILAGLNHAWFSPVQLKRMAALVDGWALAPPDLAARIDELFALALPAAAASLRTLTAETIDLVEAHAPDIDISRIRQKLEGLEP